MMIKKGLLVCFVTSLLVACGGGGGGGGGTSSSTGALVSDIRSNGFSATYASSVEYKQIVDAFLQGMNEIVNEISTAVKWGENIPVIFSGCGTENAFFATSGGGVVSVHQLLQGQGVADPGTTFGTDTSSNSVTVFCHELTEKALQTFLVEPYASNIASLFNSPEEGYVYSALMFELQVFFHELGHGMDFLLLKDADNSTKLQNFAIPFADQCAQNGCNTISEDFADWMAAYLLTEALKEQTGEDAAKFAAGFIVAISAWPDIMGVGGDIAHGFTEARQANILCYAYGGAASLREADATYYNYQLATTLNGYLGNLGYDYTACETIYQTNATASETLLGGFVN